MNKQDIREIKIVLDDNIIKDVDKDGEEKLRLGLKCNGKTIYIRFPTWGQWDNYVTEVAKLLMILGQTTQDIQIPEMDKVDQGEFYNWAKLSSVVLRYKACRELVDTIFFTYLRPEIDPMEYKTDDHQVERNQWLRDNLNMAHIFQMFTSILYIDDWFKKKAHLHLTRSFPELIPLLSKVTLQENTTSRDISFNPGVPYVFN